MSSQNQAAQGFATAALKAGHVILPATDTDPSDQRVADAFAVEMANLGFVIENPRDIVGSDISSLTDALAAARGVVGADRNMVPVYPGFPKQVQELSTATLLFEQILHYWTGGGFLPDYPTVAREGLPIEDMVRGARGVKIVKSEYTAAAEIFADLSSRKVAFSSDEILLLEGVVKILNPLLGELHSAVKAFSYNGENQQSLIAAFLKISKASPSEVVVTLAPLMRDADRLLRLVLVVAGEPVSGEIVVQGAFHSAVRNLVKKHNWSVRFKSLSQKARRAVMHQLGEVTNGFDADRLVARKDMWRRVMKSIHPYSVPLTVGSRRAADIIHNNIEYQTFNSLVEGAIAEQRVTDAIKLLAEHQPGNLVRRAVALTRASKNIFDVSLLANSIVENAESVALTTLVSAYNGVIAANDNHARVTRVAGIFNKLRGVSNTKIAQDMIDVLLEGIVEAIKKQLSDKPLVGVVGTASDAPVPLVRRDLASSDRVLSRGERAAAFGEGDTVRIFGHWNNNMLSSGYMDVGVVVLDKYFENLDVITWDSWASGRDWATYSGDKLVEPGNSAAEYIDADLLKLQKAHPKARWIAMTVQSWSGFPTADVDFLAGAMLRSKPDSGEVFDARSVVSAFKPTTQSTQSVPLVFDLETREMIWIDTSNGSTMSGTSSKSDDTIGALVYDEIARPRMSMGDLARFWADAIGSDTDDSKPVDSDALMNALGLL